MAKQIKSNDFLQPNIFAPFREDAEKAVVLADKLDKGLIDVANAFERLLKSSSKSSLSGINQFIAASKELNTVTNQTISYEKEKMSVQKQIDKQRQDEIKAYERFQKEVAKRSAAEEKAHAKREAQYNKEIAAAEKLNQPYNKLSATLNRLRGEYKNLAAAGRENEKEAKDLRLQIELLDSKLKGIDASTRPFQRSVGNYEKGLGRLKFSFRDVINVAGQFGLALGGIQIAKGAIETLKNFDEGAADIAKTVGITTEQARELSRELLKIDTRTGVAELQKIAAIGGQLGITKNEIEGFTEATDKLNVALGDEFTGGAEEITTVIGGLRNVFGDIKSANVQDDLLKIGNALNTLGAEGAATSPIMADFAGRIGGIGIPLGLSTDEVLGLSATLQELNVNAERGGTAIGKVLQKMTVDTKGFAKIAGMDLKDFENLVNTDIYGAFQAVIKGTKDSGTNATELGKTLDKLGLDGAGTSEVFLKLGENMDLLETRTTSAGEALKGTDSILDEFNVKNNTLGANFDKLSKNWDAYVIGLDSATGASSALSHTIGTIANNIPLLIGWITKLTASFFLYKTAVFVVNGGMKDLFQNFFRLKKPMLDANNELVKGKGSLTGFGNALKGIGWSVAIAGAITLGSAFIDMVTGADRALSISEKLAKIEAFNDARRTEQGKKVSTELEGRRKAISLEIDLLRKQGVTASEIANARARMETSLTNKVNDEIVQGDQKIFVLRMKLRDLEQEILDNKRAGAAGSEFISRKELKRTEGEIEAIEERNETRRTFLDILNQEESATDESIKSTDEDTKSKKKNTITLRDNNDELRKRIELISNERNIRQEIRQLEEESVADDVNRFSNDELAKQRKSATETGQVNVDVLESIIEEEFELRRKAAEQQAEFDIKNLTENLKAERELAIQSIDEERDELLKQEKLTEAERVSINESFQQRKDEINAEFIEKERLVSLERIKIELELKRELNAISESEQARLNEVNDELYDLQKKYADDQNTLIRDQAEEAERIRAEAEEKEKKRIQELAEFRKKTISDAIDEIKKESEEREKLLDKRISDEQRFQDQLQAQANAGNIQAQQSIAASEAAEQKATIAKQEEAEQQKRLDDLKVFYQLIESNLEKAKADGTSPLAAIAKAIAQTGIVKGAAKVISGIPGFFKGTKGKLSDEMAPNINTGSDPDNRLVRLAGNEMVLNGGLVSKAEKAGLRTTDDILDSALMFRRMNMGEMNMGTRLLVSKKSPDKTELYLKQLVNIMDSKEEFRLDPIIVKGIAVGVASSSKNGNIEKYNKFIPRK